MMYKFISYLPLTIALTLLSACISSSQNTPSHLLWHNIKGDLYKNSKGDVALKVQQHNPQHTTYVKTFWDEENTGFDLKTHIDISTFESFGNGFYKDKDNAYEFYDTASGGRLLLREVKDIRSFNAYGDCYAKDKEAIYNLRHGQLKQVDYDTFKTQKGIGCYAKDKHGYYFWDDLLLQDMLQDKEMLLIIQKLDKIQ